MVKNLLDNSWDVGSIPGSGRPPGEGNSNPLQYSCLENPMDREAWRATVHGITKSQTRQQLNWTEAHPGCLQESLRWTGPWQLVLSDSAISSPPFKLPFIECNSKLENVPAQLGAWCALLSFSGAFCYETWLIVGKSLLSLIQNQPAKDIDPLVPVLPFVVEQG